MSEDVNPKTLRTTVADLMELIERQKMALTEGGRPDLAERVHVTVWPNGTVALSFERPVRGSRSTPAVKKALTLDPKFKPGVRL